MRRRTSSAWSVRRRPSSDSSGSRSDSYRDGDRSPLSSLYGARSPDSEGISGTPTANGTFTFTVTATDPDPNVPAASRQFPLGQNGNDALDGGPGANTNNGPASNSLSIP
ncbi:hypothetical protein FNV68_28290 [Streptomyces sp. S1D4-23]|nr:hypothetical protein FNV61_27075 [Streptomyces sp. RLB3-6]QDO14545.1 hypothetical protein FNV68_28290 [Streptomyces sp. S1D4-23]